MSSLSELESRLRIIEQRNSKVETEKAWETSLSRRVLLMIFTYLAIGLYMQYIQIDRAWLNAIVPSVGFLLSTLTLPTFKNLWLKYFYRR